MHRHPEEQVVRQLAAIAEHRNVPVGVQRPHQPAGMPVDPPLLEGGENRLGRLRRRWDRHRQWHDQRHLGALPQPAILEEVVHQQGGLTRRGRAFERGRRHPDQDPAALEPVENLTQCESARHGVELVPTFEKSRRGLGVEIGAECNDEDVCFESLLIGAHHLCDRVDRRHFGADEAHARLHDIVEAVQDMRGVGVAEHDVQLREAEDESLTLVDQHDVDIVAELLGQQGREFQPTEAGPEDNDPHRGSIPT